MEDKKYKEFFKEIKEFLAEQKLQRLRGLNDYNILKVVRNPNEEVGLHSRFLYSFLDINGEHYQNNLFVNIFIKNVLELNDFGRVLRVEREDLTDKNRRIDFTIKSEKYLIGIEMKIDADDQEQQIYDYHKFLEGVKTDNQEVIIYYLTKYGVEASEKSYINGDKKIEYKQISFKKDILKWIEECQKEVKNITNLNYALKEYKEIVEIITEEKKEKVMNLTDKILEKENEDWLEIAEDIHQAYPKIMEKKTESILIKIQESFNNKNWNTKLTEKKALDINIDDEITIRIFKSDVLNPTFKIQTIKDEKFGTSQPIKDISNIEQEIENFLCSTKQP